MVAATNYFSDIKILFLEDREDDYILITRFLKSELDYKSVWAKDESALRDLLQSFEPDVVISDYNMSGISGKDALLVVKEVSPDTPFIMLSGSIGEEKVVEILKLGATDFVMKDNLVRLPRTIIRAIKEAASKLTIRETQNALRESQQRLQMAIEGGGIGLWDWHVSEKVYFNQEFADMIGYRLSELQEDAQNWEKYIHKEDFEALKSSLVNHLKGEFSFFRIEFRMLTKSGKYRWIMAHGKVIERDEQMNASRMIGVYLDIHERKTYEKALRSAYDNLEHKVEQRTEELQKEVEKRKQTEEKLKQAKEQAEFANLAKSEFLANMSHEIRSPLNAIVGFSQILMNQVKDKKYPKNFKEQLSYIKISGETLTEVINDILDISKIEEGEMTLSYENVELESLFRGIYHINKQAADQKNLNFNYSFSKKIPKTVRIDRTKVKQILMNLVSNAIKYTPDGQKVIMSALFNPSHQVVIFKIIDEGIGIPKNQLKAIFKRFKQVDNSMKRAHGGTGLGLAITKRLVNLLNGSISVESKLKKGSTFTVELPFLNADEHQTNSEDFNLENYSFDKDNLVLIIEDNPLNVKMIQTLLKSLSIKVVHCDDGLKGIRLADELKPDLILMDMHMPKMDGIETTHAIRKIESCKNIPIVALSADAFDNTRKAAKEAGIDEYITKPIKLGKLMPVLQRFLKEEKNKKANQPESVISPELKMKIKEELLSLKNISIYQTEKLIEKVNLIEEVLVEYDADFIFELKTLKEEIYSGNLTITDQLIKKLEDG